MATNFGLGSHLRLMNPEGYDHYLPVTDSQTRLFKNILNGNYGENYDEYVVYHLWLECLYKINLHFSDVIIGLERLLTTKSRKKFIDYDKIFVLGCRWRDGTMKPAGSCFILISKSIVDSCDFEEKILEKRVKMMEVSYQILREQLRSNHIIMFNEAGRKLQQQTQQLTTPQTRMLAQIQTKTSTQSQTKPQSQTEPKKSFATVVESDENFYSQSSKKSSNLMSKLIKIQNRGHAERLAVKCNRSDVTYIKFFVTGTTKIGPSLFNCVFPNRDLIHMSDIFLCNVKSNMKRNSVSGFTFVNIYPDVFMKSYMGSRESTFRIKDVRIEIKIIDYHTFRSMLLNFEINYKFRDLPEDEESKQVESPSKGRESRSRSKRQKLIDNAAQEGKVISKSSPTNIKLEPVIEKQLINNPIKLESVLNYQLDNEDKLNEFVSNTVTKLLLNGNIILRVLNLPATLTIHQLNLLMGTYTLLEKQIVAVKRPRNNLPDLMDLMIVIREDNLDKKRILNKDHIKTQHHSTLVCGISTILELERFLKRNHNNLHKFKNQETLPTNQGVGYTTNVLNKGLDLATKINAIGSSKQDEPKSVIEPFGGLLKSYDLIRNTLERLKKFGTIVLRVGNLPENCSLTLFNEIFGTYTIQKEQIVSVIKKRERGGKLMECRIVLNPSNLDVPRILSKNLTEAHGEYLICKETSISELESFLATNKDNFCDIKR